MAQKSEHPLLQRPLYVFDLPEEILNPLTLKGQSEQQIQNARPQETPPVQADDNSESDSNGPAKATSCNLCSLSFSTVAEQRSHVRSDLHGYNLKQRIKGLRPVGEEEFEKLIGDLDESISGSESDESDEEEL